MKPNLFFIKHIKSNLLIVSILALCGCYDPPCPDPYDPATMEFREYVKSLDGKYRFRKLYINGVDSTSILDSIQLKGHLLRTYDYDHAVFTQTRNKCGSFAYFSGNNINTINKVLYGTISSITQFQMATRHLKPSILVLWLFNQKSNSTNGVYIDSYPTYYMNSLEYQLKLSNDTLSFTTNSANHEIKFILY